MSTTVAIENAWLYEEVRDKVALEERPRSVRCSSRRSLPREVAAPERAEVLSERETQLLRLLARAGQQGDCPRSVDR